MENKNIWLVPTNQASRLYKSKLKDELYLHPTEIQKEFYLKSAIGQNIYITDNSEIKNGDWYIGYYKKVLFVKKRTAGNLIANPRKKIILTTDLELIKNGVQPIPDNFLEWFCQNSSCEFVEVVKDLRQIDQNNLVTRGSTTLVEYYKLIIPQEETKIEEIYHDRNSISLSEVREEPKQRLEKYSERFDNKDNELIEGIFNPENWGKRLVKEETLEEAKSKFCNNSNNWQGSSREDLKLGWDACAKWKKEQEKHLYSEKDMITFGWLCREKSLTNVDLLFNQFKK